MRRFGFNSLAANITVVVLLASAISLSISLVAMLIVDWNDSILRFDMRMNLLADVVGQNSTAALSFEDRKSANETLQALGNDTAIMTGCIYDVSGQLFAAYQRDANTGMRACPANLTIASTTSREQRTVTRQIQWQNETVGTIRLLGDMSFVKSRQKKIVPIAMLMLFVSLVAGGLAGLLLQFRITKPIFDLSRVLLQVTRGNTFNLRVKVTGSTEIRRLSRGLNNMLAELESRDQKTRAAESLLVEQANTDALTGLPNRRYFTERLRHAMSMSRKQQTMLGLLYLDLDGFKLVNDSLGHSIGDVLLREVVKRLQMRIAPTDTLARLGGDEFSVILTSIKDAEEAERAARTLLASFEQPFRLHGHEISIAASVGVSLSYEEMSGGGELLQQADSAMYAAKQRGRNCVVFFTQELGMMARERLNLESQMRSALTRQEFFLHYQPEFDLKTHRLVRFEALARWNHPHLGLVPPDKFIPIAEQSGLIHALGYYLLELACKEAVQWQPLTSEPVEVAVNFSAIQFNSATIVEEVVAILDRTGLPPHLLQIELTETTMIDSIQRSTEKMNRLRALGVHMSIDDFGTGYSCLSYLPDLPVDAIKVDRSFVRNLRPDSDAAAMLKTIVDLAHKMKLQTIIEGVEDDVQLRLARELGADEAQGYLLGRPGPEPGAVLQMHAAKSKIA